MTWYSQRDRRADLGSVAPAALLHAGIPTGGSEPLAPCHALGGPVDHPHLHLGQHAELAPRDAPAHAARSGQQIPRFTSRSIEFCDRLGSGRTRCCALLRAGSLPPCASELIAESFRGRVDHNLKQASGRQPIASRCVYKVGFLKVWRTTRHSSPGASASSETFRSPFSVGLPGDGDQ